MKQQNDEMAWDRRRFLTCMAWVGTGAVWTMTSGVLKGMPIEQAGRDGAGIGGLRFVQISDTHIGFNRDANPDVTATLRAAIAKIQALPQAPSFVLHTGDLTHLSKPEEFDALQQELSGIGAPLSRGLASDAIALQANDFYWDFTSMNLGLDVVTASPPGHQYHVTLTDQNNALFQFSVNATTGPGTFFGFLSDTPISGMSIFDECPGGLCSNFLIDNVAFTSLPGPPTLSLVGDGS